MSFGGTAQADEAPVLVRYYLSTHFVDSKQSYYIDLLCLAMEKSLNQYGDYRMQAVPLDMSQRRTMKLVEQGRWMWREP